jgi:hypothetical protein
VDRTPRELWLDEKAQAAGFAGAAALLDALGGRAYRGEQLYRAAVRELAPAVADVTVLPREAREALTARGLRLEDVEPVTIQR